MIWIGTSSVSGAAAVPPPEPDIRPIVGAPSEVDMDESRVDDRLEDEAAMAQSALDLSGDSIKMREAALQRFDAPVEVELIFSRQITQGQLDAFIQAGGSIRHIFTRVSYGWTGSISLKNALSLPERMGPTLLGVVQNQPTRLCMDKAARCGRVRPVVWDAGFNGRRTGDNRITIAILDTGVDPTHTDLAGREEYWKDCTADNRTTARDVGHHGSLVAGVATGTSVAAGINPDSISFMDLGNLPDLPGVFYLGPIRIPTSVNSVDWTSTMVWSSGGGVVAKLAIVSSDANQGWALMRSAVSGTESPLIKSEAALPNPPAGRTNRWAVYSTKESGSGTPEYAVATTVSYDGTGDGYPAFRGVAPDCQWAGIKIFREDGTGGTIDFGEGLDEAVAQRSTHQIKVANMSAGVAGNPGIHSTLRNKANSAALNGVVLVIAAGNDGAYGADSIGEIDDPGRAQYAITVAAGNELNQLTDYSSHGFSASGSSGENDMKPDLIAPGGSQWQSHILSIDSNTGDSEKSTGANLPDSVPNNYLHGMGTSLASPFVAGCAALVIEAMEESGASWHFTGSHSEPLNDVLKVKMLLLMTATETNQSRETGPSGNPTLDRGGKDINEGFGIVNADAAVDAARALPYSGETIRETFGDGPYDKRCWARTIAMTNGAAVRLELIPPMEGDFDLYLYNAAPDSFGNPQILAASLNPGAGATEQLDFKPTETANAYLVVKRVSGSGMWTLITLTGKDNWFVK